MPKTKIRVLHVIPGLLRTGGVSIWLRSVLRAFDRERYQFDFLPKAVGKCPREESTEEELLGYGGKIHRCEELRRPVPWGGALRRVLDERYDIVHEHNLCEGSVLWEARRAGSPVRIAHVHNDVHSALTTGRWVGRLVRHTQVWLTRWCATHGFACSDLVGRRHFGRGWERDPRWRLLLYGIDFSAFETPVDRLAVRGELGLPGDAFVVGNVGRFAVQKNHPFLLRVFAEVRKREPSARLLCVGDGPERTAIAEQIEAMGLGPVVLLAGARGDIPRLLLGAIDVFLFPSLYEGLPFALLEAQAAGLPCVLSEGLSRQTDVVTSLMHRVSLRETPARWAEHVRELRGQAGDGGKRNAALSLMRQSPFSIEQSARRLVSEYDEIVKVTCGS